MNDDMDSTLTAPAPAGPLATLPMTSLRQYRLALKEEEERVSYWRRLVQARLDLIKAEKATEHVTTVDLLRSLGSTGTGARRQQLLSVDAQDELPQLPGLQDLWTRAVDPHDTDAVAALSAELAEAEAVLSEYRQRLHHRIDAATSELVNRYKADPNLSLDLYPVNVR